MGFEKKRDMVMRLRPDILVLQGQEATPTQFMYRHLAKSYHLDYAFVSQTISTSCELRIGEPSDWLHKSDHMPLLLTISI